MKSVQRLCKFALSNLCGVQVNHLAAKVEADTFVAGLHNDQTGTMLFLPVSTEGTGAARRVVIPATLLGVSEYICDTFLKRVNLGEIIAQRFQFRARFEPT